MENDNIELQLLVIDLGDSCAVKVEKGQTDSDFYGQRLLANKTRLMSGIRFSAVRAVIDAMMGVAPPVPRIELDEAYGRSDRPRTMFAVFHEEGSYSLDSRTYEHLSQLAGKPLPIWTPTKGEWKELCCLSSDYPAYLKADCTIYRYTRRTNATS